MNNQIDVRPTPRTTDLVAEVEALFGIQVLYLLCPGIAEHAAAVLNRADDTPTIEFRAVNDADETTVFHELCHLRLLARGFPIYRVSITTLMVPYKGMLDRVYCRTRAAMQHALFFPLMREKGFDPTAATRRAIASMHVSARGSRGRDLSDFELAADLVQTHMSGDEEALQLHISVLRERGWDFAVDKAKCVSDFIRQQGFDAPRLEAAALVGALNILFDGQPRAQLGKWLADMQKRPTYSLNEVELIL